ncbi:MAG: UPF0147 family protein [Euryarchaeota archaeon]|nr:UPF0147 family protein [Euryarchaeota archaeon]
MIEKSAQPKKSAHAPNPSKSTPPPAKPHPSAAKAAPVSPETKAKIDQVCGGLDMLQEDTSVPRNIRRGAEDAKKLLLNETMALDVRKSGAINILDELANDPNIPLHGRTLIWSIMSQLEPLA